MARADLERRFHFLIKDRLRKFGLPTHMAFPTVDPLAVSRETAGWFPVEGMQGGFRYWIEEHEGAQVLISESWSRRIPGSAQRHRVDLVHTTLLAEGAEVDSSL